MNCRFVALESGKMRIGCACPTKCPTTYERCAWRIHHGFDDKHGKGYYRKEGFPTDPLLL